ncbi:uncharacterized protein LOC142138708 isoform X2 [Mixophyes fleayi]|uniref:uncharacterized protein LOC142138708 isoform X2 n=1 Tax=Mixophyes fleayi TaxID=3061075 RepID=UPI003F4D9FF3
MATNHHNERETNDSQMDEIRLIQSWSRYNNKVQALQQTLGMPSGQKSEMKETYPRWGKYEFQVQALEKKIGLFSHDNSQLTFHKAGYLQADDTSRKASLAGKRHMTRRELHREVIKHFEPSEVQSMMESYSQDPQMKVSDAPPMQEMIDKVLIRRSIAHSQRQKHHDEAIRKLEAAKEHLKKELKNLEAQHEFFGNGGTSQAAAPINLKLSSEHRHENENANPVSTDLLKGLDTDDYLLDEVVEEVMSANYSHQPKNMNPGKTKQLQKLMLEISIDRAVLLTEEEMILEAPQDFRSAVHHANSRLYRVKRYKTMNKLPVLQKLQAG